MKTARARMIFDCLRNAVLQKGAGLTDGQLLRQYFAHRDETAFATLVRRHGPMVLAVCRRLLRRAEDAEDAFQAAFVVLARKGLRIAERQTIGGWLHGVAYRVALDVRRRGARRWAKEQQVEDMPHPLVMPGEDQSELLALLDRELNRLPDKYRLPVILCELEGRSRKDAARQLGLAEGTLSSRLATARKTLAKRMAGHGAAVAGASLTALFASQAGAAVVPGPLVTSTVRAAGGVVSAGVVALAEGVLKAMLLTKIKSAALLFLLASAIGVGTVGLTYRTAIAQTRTGPQNAAEAQERATKPRTAASAEKDDLESLRLEVEALRVSLQATRERVKALEAAAQAQQKPVGADGIELKVPGGISGSILLPSSQIGGATPPLPSPQTGGAAAPPPLPALQLGGSTPPIPALQPGGSTPPLPALQPGGSTPPLPALQPGGSTPPLPALQPGEGPSKANLIKGLQGSAVSEAEAGVRNAAARLVSDPTNKLLQDAMKRALEQMNSPAPPKTETPNPSLRH